MYQGQDITKRSVRKHIQYNKDVQMIFQDSLSSLNPRKRIEDIIAEPIRNFQNLTGDEERRRVQELLDIVGMPSDALYKYPHEFSGGQRQRIRVARAMATNPKLIIADEPVSALDLSVQAQVLNFMKRIQEEYNISYLFISHDLGVVKHMCRTWRSCIAAALLKSARVKISITIHSTSTHSDCFLRFLTSTLMIGRRIKSIVVEVERVFKEEESKYYSKEGRVLDLQKISDTHFVALPDSTMKGVHD